MEAHETVLRAGEEEDFRLKFSELREGLCRALRANGILFLPGVSSNDLLSILSRVMGNPTTKHEECLSTDWSNEYGRFTQKIGDIIGHPGFSEDTKPSDILESIKSRLGNIHI